MNLTMNEAIQLILDFRQFPTGFWKDRPIENPLVIRFIEEGYASLDTEYQEKYVLNNKGADLLHIYIKQISTDFILYIKGKQFTSFDADSIKWFMDKYSLDNDTAECLYDYITYNLKVYGYKRSEIHQTGKGCGYSFQKC